MVNMFYTQAADIIYNQHDVFTSKHFSVVTLIFVRIISDAGWHGAGTGGPLGWGWDQGVASKGRPYPLEPPLVEGTLW